jgi:hypothetical protein
MNKGLIKFYNFLIISQCLLKYCSQTTIEHKCYGLLKGFILRSQLNVILEHNLYLTPLHDENYYTKLELIRKSTFICDDTLLYQVS